MFQHKIFAAFAVVSIFGVAACGGSSTDQKEGTVTTLLQKNGALIPMTTAPRTVTTPMPNIGMPGTTRAPAVTTTKPILPKPAPTATTTKPPIVPTTAPRTVTTPMPTLPKR
jgi:hypothetical protein